jgi:hypothetical protein
MWRVVLGFLVCGLAYPLVVLTQGGGHVQEAATLIAAIALLALLLIGLPIVILCFFKRWFRLWQFVLAGAFTALLVGTPFLRSTPPFWLFLAVVGSAHGLLFWLVAIYRNRSLVSGRWSGRVCTERDNAA